jgi:putative aldouronate transport system permease protein
MMIQKRNTWKANTGDRIFDITLCGVMLLIGVLTLYPFINIFAISLNDANDAMRGGIYLWPRVFTLRNYAEVFQYNGLMESFGISVARTVVGTAASVLSTSMLAYTLSRNDFSARKVITVLFIITMYAQGGLIPEYLLIKMLGLYNNFLVYILPGLIGVFYILLIRTFITSLGSALQESAMIDGANDLVIFFRIVFPLCSPVIATVALYCAVGQWNSWFDTYIYTKGDLLSTLQFQMVKIMQQTTLSRAASHIDAANAPKVSPEAIRMTITIIATIPILVVYPFLQKYFVKGMTIGAVKS